MDGEDVSEKLAWAIDDHRSATWAEELLLLETRRGCSNDANLLVPGHFFQPERSSESPD